MKTLPAKTFFKYTNPEMGSLWSPLSIPCLALILKSITGQLGI